MKIYIYFRIELVVIKGIEIEKKKKNRSKFSRVVYALPCKVAKQRNIFPQKKEGATSELASVEFVPTPHSFLLLAVFPTSKQILRSLHLSHFISSTLLHLT